MFSVSDMKSITVVFFIVIATAVIVIIIMAIIIMFTPCYAVLCPQGSLFNSIMEI